MKSNRKNPKLIIMGVMTGTSCDGLDAVTVAFQKNQFEVLHSFSCSYPATLREKVLRFQKYGARHDSKSWLQLHRELGQWYATAALRGIKNKFRPDVIANHGQTVAHFPEVGTLQMGDASILAQKTGLTVVSQFRTGDMAAGGQGAPLVPRFHEILARSSGASREGCSIHNLGGISNFTYVAEGHTPLAWDTGPGNLWIDLAVEQKSGGKIKMDEGGRLALLGSPRLEAVATLLRHSYFKRRPPKSTGRDEFTENQVTRALRRLPLADAAATATLATAQSIVRDYCREILDKGLPLECIYFCGGGAKNRTLLDCIRIEFLKRGWFVRIEDSSSVGVAPQQMEAAAFAFLGKESLVGNPLGGSWTGAKAFGPPGQITPGKNWAQVFTKLQKFI